MSDRIDELWELVTSDFIGEQSRVIYARELATIAREAEAEADKWREAAFCVAYAWWEQDEDSATDYLLYRGWDTTLDGPLSFEALVEDVRQQPHPEAVKQDT